MDRALKTKFAIYSVCFVNLMYMLPAVAVSGMVAAFPQAGENTVLLVLTLPNLTSIPGLLAVPALERRFSQKQLTAAALAASFACGALSLVFHAVLPVLIALSALLGIAYGMTSTLFPLLVSGHFSGAERSQVMGVASGMLQLGRVAAVLVGGALAGFGWYHIYWCFALVLAALLAAAFWLPRAPETQAGGQTGPEADRWDKPATAGLAAVGFCFAALYFITSTHLSLYIEGNGLGTAAMTGALTALGSVLSGALAAAYGWLRRFTGPYTFALALLLLGAGYVLAALRVTFWGAVVCICGASMGMALFSPCLMLGFARCAGGRYLPTVTALVLTIVNVGYFVSPYLTGALGTLLPGSGAAPVFLAAGLLALAGAAFLAARAAWKR